MFAADVSFPALGVLSNFISNQAVSTCFHPKCAEQPLMILQLSPGHLGVFF